MAFMVCDHVPTGMSFLKEHARFAVICSTARVSKDNFKQNVSAKSEKYYHRLAQ